MTALTVRLPDEKHRRLKALAKSRGTPLNRLIDPCAANLALQGVVKSADTAGVHVTGANL